MSKMCIEPPRPPLRTVHSPEDLGHDHVGVGPASDRVAVGAVGADQVVVGAHRRGGADDRRFLADRQVQEPASLGTLVLTPRFLLEAADQRHLLEQLPASGRVGQFVLALLDSRFTHSPATISQRPCRRTPGGVRVFSIG